MWKHNQALKLNETAVKCESLQDLVDCSEKGSKRRSPRR